MFFSSVLSIPWILRFDNIPGFLGTVDILIFLSLWMVEHSVSSTVPCFYLSHWVLGNWRPFSSCAWDGSWTCELISALWFMALLSLFWASVWCAPDLSSLYMFIVWPSMGARSLCWTHLALQSWLGKFPPPPKTSQMVLPLVANSLVGLAIEEGCPLNALQVWSAQRICLHTFKIFWVVIPLVGGFCCCVKPLQLQRLNVLQQTDSRLQRLIQAEGEQAPESFSVDETCSQSSKTGLSFPTHFTAWAEHLAACIFWVLRAEVSLICKTGSQGCFSPWSSES